MFLFSISWKAQSLLVTASKSLAPPSLPISSMIMHAHLGFDLSSQPIFNSIIIIISSSRIFFFLLIVHWAPRNCFRDSMLRFELIELILLLKLSAWPGNYKRSHLGHWITGCSHRHGSRFRCATSSYSSYMHFKMSHSNPMQILTLFTGLLIKYVFRNVVGN